MTEKVLLSWSGGKDSSLALHEIKKTKRYEISSLLTTVTEDYDRTSMHGLRRTLLERQAYSLGLPLEKVLISKDISKEEYESKMREVLEKYMITGVKSIVFGDIFLEDVKKHREDNLSKIGMNGIFPLWKRKTNELAQTFIDSGLKAVVICIDSTVLDKTFAGRFFDKQFLSDLPSNVDPCGENGEFHSFVYDGPIFKGKVSYLIGEVVQRDNRFYYCDLIPF